MILRVAATVSLLAGIAASGFYLHWIGKSPTSSVEARHLRDMKDRIAEPTVVETASFAEMAGLPRQRNVAEYSGVERRAVSLDGYVQRVVRATDGDLHLEIVPVARQPEDPLLEYVTAEITPQWHRHSASWRYGRLAERFRPTFGGVTAWERGTRRVRISGWLLYDYEYPQVASPADRRLTAWEIHPVTRIETWDATLGRFAEYSR